MAYQEMTLSAIDLKKYPNKPLEAYYLGSREIETQFGSQIIHHFEKPNGDKVDVYGFRNMDNLLAAIPKGCMTKVSYTGKKNVKTKFGMKDVNQASVLYDDKRFIESSRIPAAVNAAGQLEPAGVGEGVEDDEPPF